LSDLVGRARCVLHGLLRCVETGDFVLDPPGKRLKLRLLSFAEHDAVLIVDGICGLPAEPAAPFHPAGDAELNEPIVDRPGGFDLHGRYLADVDPLVGVADDETGQPAVADGDELTVEFDPAA
jgi:hypothetical protein